ncbi:MAG: hypothetical protein COV31_02480 [Candidatus Yanofskybacteria bacterium CG10_big_fil_rev_8_21_14_0_10_46_23]|uniref:Uncharacterized protein n=1 Tax=Candidatus Yanofskybacteria bacterium CG10_big_fil_rev_8_21_14_0_10_46_23 TaxID=1975098 RepID=A0A2H0R408_9BACT|nr:MAG: hypothetical protein COV31_02480 [Candidatus Yanofskybacteria bacterium CG10_big_fil_rev_8_21_14_0_10_46_23]
MTPVCYQNCPEEPIFELHFENGACVFACVEHAVGAIVARPASEINRQSSPRVVAFKGIDSGLWLAERKRALERGLRLLPLYTPGKGLLLPKGS